MTHFKEMADRYKNISAAYLDAIVEKLSKPANL
jgi:hypothetical protein